MALDYLPLSLSFNSQIGFNRFSVKIKKTFLILIVIIVPIPLFPQVKMDVLTFRACKTQLSSCLKNSGFVLNV